MNKVDFRNLESDDTPAVVVEALAASAATQDAEPAHVEPQHPVHDFKGLQSAMLIRLFRNLRSKH